MDISLSLSRQRDLSPPVEGEKKHQKTKERERGGAPHPLLTAPLGPPWQPQPCIARYNHFLVTRRWVDYSPPVLLSIPDLLFVNSSVHRWFWFRRLLFLLCFVRLLFLSIFGLSMGPPLSLRIYLLWGGLFHRLRRLQCHCFNTMPSILAMPTIFRFWFSTLCVTPMCHGSFHFYIFNVCAFVKFNASLRFNLIVSFRFM